MRRIHRGYLGGALVVVLAGAAVAIGAGALCCTAPTAAAAPAGDPARAAVTIEIPEVDCAGCSLVIRKAIKHVGGVRRLNEGSPKNRIVVTYEPGAGRPAVYVKALHEAGFTRARVVG
jgi:copper chaperone CopZ